MNLHQKDIGILFQGHINRFTKIELLNKDFLIIESIEGATLDYSNNVDANSDIRRTISLSMIVADSSFLVGEDKKIWLDKYLRIYVGLKSSRTDEIQWYSLGIYLFNQLSYQFDPENNSISLECCDLMSKLTGQRQGINKEITTLIPAETELRQCVIDAILDLTEFKRYDVEDTDKQIYRDLKFSTGTTVYDILSEIRDLYPEWEFFFDVDGVFHYQSIPTCIENPVILDDSILQPLVTSEALSINFEEVKNHIIVYGMLTDEEEQMQGEWKDENPDSPYCIDKIGDIVDVRSGGEYEKIYTNQLAIERAEYEGWKSTRLNDGLNLEMIDIPWLDVNQKIEFTPKHSGETCQWIIKSISRSFTQGTMSVSLIKFYPLYPYIINPEEGKE